MRIVVATDVHLGFMEKDEERGDDSFKAFEEVLRTAREQHADMVLLCGDLFHDHRPSQETLAKCVHVQSIPSVLFVISVYLQVYQVAADVLPGRWQH